MSLDRSVILGNQHVSHSMTTIEAWTAAKSKFWISHAAVIEEKERRHEAHCSCSSSKTSTVFLWNALIPSYFEPVFLCLSLILMTWAICVRQKAIKERFALVVPRIGQPRAYRSWRQRFVAYPPCWFINLDVRLRKSFCNAIMNEPLIKNIEDTDPSKADE